MYECQSDTIVIAWGTAGPLSDVDSLGLFQSRHRDGGETVTVP